MTWWMWLLAGWVAISFALAPIVGRWLRRISNEQTREIEPLEDAKAGDRDA